MDDGEFEGWFWKCNDLASVGIASSVKAGDDHFVGNSICDVARAACRKHDAYGRNSRGRRGLHGRKDDGRGGLRAAPENERQDEHGNLRIERTQFSGRRRICLVQ